MLQDNFEAQEIGENLKVSICSSPHNVSISEKVMDEIFESLQKEKPFFNGTLLCVKDFGPEDIQAYPISFKEYIASHKLPEYQHLHSPLAVSGWIIHRDKILIGMRSENVWTYPNYFEFVPSGGIDQMAIERNTVNYKYALIKEFVEETGMESDFIRRITPKFLIYSKEKQLFDICQAIELEPNSQPDCDLSNDEYQHLLWIPLADLNNFVNKHIDQFIPTSLAILNAKILS